MGSGKMKKGSFGYLKKKRILSAVKSLLLLAAVFICYFAALRHFHTNKNIFSIANLYAPQSALSGDFSRAGPAMTSV